MIRYVLAFLVAACWGSGAALVALVSIGILADRARDVRASGGRGRTRGRPRR